jgi:hypothetical protein
MKIHGSLLNIFSIVLILMMNNCSSTARLKSSDPQAQIYVDGIYLGKGSVLYKDRKVIGSHSRVDLKKVDCRVQSYLLSKDGQMNILTTAAGIVTVFPLWWSLGYADEYKFYFPCEPIMHDKHASF